MKPAALGGERKSEGDAFGDLEKLYDEAEPQPKVGEEGEPKPGDEIEGAEGAPPPDKKPGDKPAKAATLREAKDAAEKLVKEKDTELTKLRAEVEELKKGGPKPEDAAERRRWETDLENERKRAAGLEEELQFTNYERSEAYKKDFETPFVDAYASGAGRVKGLKVNDGNGGTRQGTDDDFRELMRQTDDDAAAEFAAELFGAKAPTVMYHREEVLKLHAAKEKAKEHFRTEGVKRQTEHTEKQKRFAEELGQVFNTEVKNATEKYPKWFKPVEGDTAGNDLLTRGSNKASEAFTGMRIDKDGNRAPIEPKELAAVRAAVWAKAGGFDRLASQLKAERARVKEVQEKLKQYEGSEPEPARPPRTPMGEPGKSTMESAWGDLEKRAKK